MVTTQRAATLLAASLLLSGCVLLRAAVGGPDIDDLRVLGMSFVTDMPPGPHMYMQPGAVLPALRLELTTRRDLVDFASSTGYSVVLSASVCAADGYDRRQRVAVKGWLLATRDGSWVEQQPATTQSSDSGLFSYFAYFYLTTSAGFAARHGDAADQFVTHDLRRDHKDLCVILSGGDMLGGRHRSNTVRIPAAAIRAALAAAPAE